MILRNEERDNDDKKEEARNESSANSKKVRHAIPLT